MKVSKRDARGKGFYNSQDASENGQCQGKMYHTNFYNKIKLAKKW